MGEDVRCAVEMGLAASKWYHTEIRRKDMKRLMQRSNSPAIRDNSLRIGLMNLFASIGSFLRPSFWSAPFWLAYAALYGSASESRWLECGHGTAFKTDWMNDVIYQIASFMIMRNPAAWRRSRARRRMDTIIVGRVPEIAAMRPPDALRLEMKFFGLFEA